MSLVTPISTDIVKEVPVRLIEIVRTNQCFPIMAASDDDDDDDDGG